MQQLLVDKVDVGDILHKLLQILIILYIDAVRHNHIGDVAGSVDIRGTHRDLDFSPVIHCQNRFLSLSKKLFLLA